MSDSSGPAAGSATAAQVLGDSCSKPPPDPFRLCIAIPYYGAAHALFFRHLSELMRNPPCRLAIIDIIGDSLVPRARNTLCHKFLHETDCTHLLFIDSDILFDPAHIARTISHCTDTYPVIGGLYPKKKPAPDWVLNTFEGGPTQPGPDGLIPVKFAGTGWLLTTRVHLERIAQKWPHRVYSPDSDESGHTRYDYFPIGPRNTILPDAPALDVGKERYLSEDYAFSEITRALGYPVVVDTEVRLEHLGVISYPIRADDVVPRQAMLDMEVGQKIQQHLTNVQVFEASGDHQGRRLIDVDDLATAISPKPPPA